MTPAAELLQPDSNPALYVSAVLTLYIDLPDTPLRASASDQWLARRFHDDGVPCGWWRRRCSSVPYAA